MKQELQQILFDKYPLIFTDIEKSPNQSLMSFGICTGDGWFWLIDQLCHQLQFDIDNNKEPQIKAFQIKEKYGSLRFYLETPSTEKQDAIITFAETLSRSICEVCGSTNNVKIRGTGFLKTRCEECEQ